MACVCDLFMLVYLVACVALRELVCVLLLLGILQVLSDLLLASVSVFLMLLMVV